MAATAPTNTRPLLRPQSSQGGPPGSQGSGNQVVLPRAAGLLSMERRCVEPGVYAERCGLVAMSKCLQGCCGEIDYTCTTFI